MKLTEFLEDVGRPISYFPTLRKITGSTNATILLCQFIYWRGKESDPNGWLYKESTEIEEETGLSYDEQKTARGKLKENGLLEEYYARLDHRMKFRLKLDAINEHWRKREQPIPESGITALAKAESSHSLIESETTAETTTEIIDSEEKTSLYPPVLPVTYPAQEESVTLTGKKDNLIKDPRISAYRGLAHLTPNQVQREEICNRVTDLELWQTIITGWLGHGWNPKNITGMLEVYEKGGLEKSGRNNGHKTTINPGTDREVNPNYPTGVIKSEGVPGWNETYYERTEKE